MIHILGSIDIAVLIVLLAAMPAAGILTSLHQRSSESYFMADRNLRWYAVAGSVFGTNVNSSHLIGMLGIGYSIGFAQSHYELLAVLAILLLAYVFIPIYRRLKAFTLSEYLAARYGQGASLIYTILMLVLILVQVVAAFYIGARTLRLLFHGSALEITYLQGIVFLGLVTCSYTLVGGLGAVVVTDAVQTVLMLSAGLLVAFLTFSQPEIGGFFGLLSLDASMPAAQQKMHLYLPSAHPDLPWSGALTGLVFLHFFYWTTNQYLVQRTLAARSDEDARVGVLAAGFLKLTIPFFSTACGVAGGYLFRQRLRDTTVLPDDAFLHLVDLVVPVGYGLTGLIIAGITAATFSSIDSMMNSASTLFTLDIYKKYLRPQASDRALVRTGRITVVTLAVLGGLLALVTYDPAGAGNFFLSVSSRGSYVTPGVVVAFFLGVFWPRASLRGAVATMAAAPIFGVLVELLYNRVLADVPAVAMLLGSRLNFLHRVCVVAIACALVHVLVSRRWPDRASQATSALVAARLPWRRIGLWALAQIVLIACIHVAGLAPRVAAVPAAVTTLLVFLAGAPYRRVYNRWAGLLSAVTIALLYVFA